MNPLPVPVAFMPGGSEWIVILLLVLLLFGAKRLPELARSLGKGMSEFKKAMDEATSEIRNAANDIKTAADGESEPEPKKNPPTTPEEGNG